MWKLGCLSIASALALSACQVGSAPPDPVRLLTQCVPDDLSCGSAAEQWSCALACELDEQGAPLAIRNEAGFYATSRWASSSVSRVFYSFQHAAQAPETKPIFVLFNGGPGVSTSGNLLAFNTGNATVLDGLDALDEVAINANSWTAFANVLYLDAPGTGLSYDVPSPPSNKGPFTDAAAMVSVLLRFLETHPALHDRPVVLVGESYGGARAAFMLQMLLHPERLRTSAAFGSIDNTLATRIENHVAAVTAVPVEQLTTAQFAQPFCGQVLIQPALPDRDHQDVIEEQILGDPGSDLWLSVSDEELESLWAHSDNQVLQPDALSNLTGVDVSQIGWMYASARVGVKRGTSCTTDQSAMKAVFGEIHPPTAQYANRDCYYLRKSPAHSFTLASKNLDDWLMVENLLHVNTFMTIALEDRRIITLDNVMPAILGDHASVGQTWVDLDDTQHERPGYLGVEITPNATYNQLTQPEERLIRYPRYEAGHMVSMATPAELATDLAEWWSEIAGTCTP